VSAPLFWNWRTLALALGAAIGIGFAWLLEFSGHSSWAVLFLIVGAVVPSGLGLVSSDVRIPLVPKSRRSRWLTLGSALLMVGLTVAACLAFDFNPRVAYYLPLFPSVFICAVLFGFGASLFAVIASIAAADFFFAPPVFDFQITEWEDVLGLATFGIIGALVALAIDEFLSFPD
jgi:hypothetical protein